jgi:hypothetical protein
MTRDTPEAAGQTKVAHTREATPAVTAQLVRGGLRAREAAGGFRFSAWVFPPHSPTDRGVFDPYRNEARKDP